ncbi:cytochrome P450 [Xylariomycetidae sp. FL2044]|nr:cytochrome P450 [Xylariomycetidae sp. FL2044]
MALMYLLLFPLLGLIYFFYRLRQQRALFKNLPGPPHHPIWGHLPIMAGVARSLPRDADPQSYAHYIRKKYDLGDFFYMDLWPAAPPQLVIVHPDLAAQIAQSKTTFRKGDMVGQYLRPLIGQRGMVASNGHAWKMSRRLFTPGLLHSNLLQHVPDCVDDTLQFREQLLKYADSGEIFALEHLTARLIFNIASRIILGVSCDDVRGENKFMAPFLRQAQLLPIDFWSRYFPHPNPMVHYRRRTNGAKLDASIGEIVDARFAARTQLNAAESAKKKHVVVDYAIDAHIENSTRKGDRSVGTRIDDDVREDIISQVKTLIFAGHDSSSSTIAYAFYLLAQNPDAYEKLRAEHDEVLGTDIAESANQLKSDPKILNRLPYTLAVIKETLRMLPPIVGSYRFGRKDTPLYHEGQSWPTYPFACFINNHAMMRRGDVFRDPERFMPERYLVADPADPYFVPKNAWRAFEHGSRDCIGSTMALIQIKIALALTARTFDFRESYPADAPEVDGEKMYGTFHVTAKPSLGLPCVASFASRERAVATS